MSMINLIPPIAQKKLKQEYWIRVISLWALLASAAGLVLAVLVIPVYVLVSIQLNAQVTDVAVAEGERSSLVEAEAALRQAGIYARLVVSEEGLLPLTQHITLLNELAGGGISFTDYQYQQLATDNSIIIKGEASTRADLATFRDRLEAQSDYTDIVLPISALIRETDIDFSITLTVASSTS